MERKSFFIIVWAIALVACGRAFQSSSNDDGGGGSGASTTTTTGTGATSAVCDTTAHIDIGCADGTREAYVVTEPSIAACAGGFDVPGVVSAGSFVASCGRCAGNSGSNPGGIGCSVADLCAEGWHVCESGTDVFSHAAVTQACPTDGTAPEFWLTRQSQTATGVCDPVGSNNLIGCGSGMGNVIADALCAPLNVRMLYNDCEASSSWNCGNATQGSNEAGLVTKDNALEGGVLCCRNP